MLLVILVASTEFSSAVDESKLASEGSETEELLRSHGATDLNANIQEERGLKDLAKSLKAWVSQFFKTNERKADAKKVSKAKELYNRGASYDAYLKAGIHPDQLYRALDLKEEMKIAQRFHGDKAGLRNYAKHSIWSKYEDI